MAKIYNVLRYVDDIKPNRFTDDTKVQWLNEVEGYIQTEVMMLALSDVVQYDPEAHMHTDLLVKPPHDKLYALYLCAMIDFANGEYDKYANTMQLYNEFLGEYIGWYTMHFRPADGGCVREGYYLSAYAIAVAVNGFEGTEKEWIASLKGETGDDAYDLAKKFGYTGTREEFGRDQAGFAENAAQVRIDREAAEQATANAEGFANQAAESADTAEQQKALAEAATRTANLYKNAAESSAQSAAAESLAASGSAAIASAEADRAGKSAAAASDAQESAEGAKRSANTFANSAGNSAVFASNEAERAKSEADRAEQTVKDTLQEAKDSGEFDGPPGDSPYIGENGRWYVGETDTGIPAQAYKVLFLEAHPGQSTVGYTGQFAYDTSANRLYVCVVGKTSDSGLEAVFPYVWEPINTDIPIVIKSGAPGEDDYAAAGTVWVDSSEGDVYIFYGTHAIYNRWVKINVPKNTADDEGKVLTIVNGEFVWATPESELFVAEYGVTTFADVNAAADAGKLCRCHYPPLDMLAELVQTTAVSCEFVRVNVSGTLFRVRVTSDDKWEFIRLQLKSSADVVETISEISENSKIPTAKAVYDAILRYGGKTETFEVNYGNTTYEEIVTACDAGKICYISLGGGSVAWLSSVGSKSNDGGASYKGYAKFTKVNENPFQIEAYEIIEPDEWSYKSYTGLTTSSRTTVVDDKSTDSQVPSAKAVYSAIQEHGGGGASVDIDSTLTQSGKAADAKATGDKIGEVSKAKADKGAVPVSAEIDANNLVSFKNAEGIVLFTLQLTSGGGSGGEVEPEEPATPFEEVNWLDTAYVVGENNQYRYNAWCPDTVAFDDTRNVIVFMQTHGANHSASVQDKTLVTIDPYDPTVYTKIDTFPAYTSGDSVGGLLVDNGVWTAYGIKKRHRSNDGGATWSTVDVVTPPARMYGVYKIDDVLYCGDDFSTTDTSHNGYYYVSYDDGINWEQKVFDFASDYAVPCSEARFCKWDGELYASIRREGETGLLAKMVDGVWTVIYEELPNVSSDSSLLAFEGCIAISSIDRPNMKLILSVWDGETLTVRKEYNFKGVTSPGDFHTPTYLHGSDWQAVFFMTNSCDGRGEYKGAINAAVLGYMPETITNTPTYEIETTTYTWEDVLDSPSHNCTVSKTTNGLNLKVTETGKNAFINTTKPYPGVNPPDENGHPYTYVFVSEAYDPYAYFPDFRYAVMTIDTKVINGRIYGCVTKTAQSQNTDAVPLVKIMGVANKCAYTDCDMSGALYCMGVHKFVDKTNFKYTGTVYRVKQDA